MLLPVAVATPAKSCLRSNGRQSVHQLPQITLRQICSTSLQPLDAIEQFPEPAIVAMRIGIKVFVSWRRPVDLERREKIVDIPDWQIGPIALECCRLIERIQLTNREIEKSRNTYFEKAPSLRSRPE